MSSHARLSPSNHRWAHCPGSIREEEPYPDVSGSAAIDGTGSHLLLEMCLKNGVRADIYDGQIIGVGHHDQPNGWLVGIDRCNRVQQCLDYIFNRVQELKNYYGVMPIVEAESKSNPGEKFFRLDWYGTTDVTICIPGLYLEVIDYKDGQGFVSVTGYGEYGINTQLSSYLYGKLSKEENTRVTIVQPKITKEPIRFLDVTYDVVNAEAHKLAEEAHKTDDPNAPLNAGPWCTWCKKGRAGDCIPYNEYKLQAAEIKKEKKASKQLTIEQMFSNIVTQSKTNN